MFEDELKSRLKEQNELIDLLSNSIIKETKTRIDLKMKLENIEKQQNFFTRPSTHLQDKSNLIKRSAFENMVLSDRSLDS